jgi:hypothetical protein
VFAIQGWGTGDRGVVDFQAKEPSPAPPASFILMDLRVGVGELADEIE